MLYTVSETFGDKPIAAWIETRFKSYVLEHYGVKIQVSVNPVSADTNVSKGADRCSQRLESDAPSTRG
ncbi:hypothetical protein [Paenibacillus guangzhouensis]|uniref:hypothetical protein n=1 Tax=Paenibacillus guangzhouensis TaxID=1473112 RepID=UPI00126740C6|nr:hypothetical protein [Paenibacillus guangzhouensis]